MQSKVTEHWFVEKEVIKKNRNRRANATEAV